MDWSQFTDTEILTMQRRIIETAKILAKYKDMEDGNATHYGHAKRRPGQRMGQKHNDTVTDRRDRGSLSKRTGRIKSQSSGKGKHPGNVRNSGAAAPRKQSGNRLHHQKNQNEVSQ